MSGMRQCGAARIGVAYLACTYANVTVWDGQGGRNLHPSMASMFNALPNHGMVRVTDVVGLTYFGDLVAESQYVSPACFLAEASFYGKIRRVLNPRHIMAPMMMNSTFIGMAHRNVILEDASKGAFFDNLPGFQGNMFVDEDGNVLKEFRTIDLACGVSVVHNFYDPAHMVPKPYFFATGPVTHIEVVVGGQNGVLDPAFLSYKAAFNKIGSDIPVIAVFS